MFKMTNGNYVNKDFTSEVNENKNLDYKINSLDTPVWKQSIATVASGLSTLSAGFTVGYSAILLPQLNNHETIKLDEDLSSWIASIAPLSMCLGCVIAGYLTDGIGRRNSHMFLAAPFLVGWLLITFATNTNLLLIGRFISGLCAGAIRPLAVVYLGEMAAPQYRGIFLFMSSLSMNLGVLGSHLFGTYLSWNITAAICAVPPVLGFLIMSRLPESPTWLVNKGKIADAEKAFVWYRGSNESAQKELASIIEKQTAKTAKLTINEKVKIVFSNEFLKPFFISCILFITVQFCGVNIIPFYATYMLQNTIGNVNPYISMILIDSIRTIGAIVLVIFAKFIPRKLTFVICSIGTSIMAYLLAAYLYTKPIGWEWIPLVLMILYTGFSSSGIVTLSWSFLAEIFPARIRGFGSGVSASTSYAFLFISVKTTPSIIKNLGETVLFIIFATITIVCGLSLHFLLPETQGKTLQEIEDEYDNSKSKTIKQNKK